MGDLPEKHNLVIFIIRFKPHYFCNVRFFGIALVILAGKLERIQKQFILLSTLTAVSLWKKHLLFYVRSRGNCLRISAHCITNL